MVRSAVPTTQITAYSYQEAAPGKYGGRLVAGGMMIPATIEAESEVL
jgi:hypothetical protein